MGLPGYEPFYLRSPAHLRDELARLGLDLPVAEDDAILDTPLALAGRRVPGRFCALPVAGLDTLPDGSPGPLTLRRYTRLAEGGFDVIWLEGAFCGDAQPAGRLVLNARTLSAFQRLAVEVKAAAGNRRDSEPLLLLQLRRAGAKTESDGELEQAGEDLAAAAALAQAAGFDGVDIPADNRNLPGMPLTARDRPGPFGGTLENRSRALLQTIAAIASRAPELLIASSLSVYDALRFPEGFGVDESDFRRMDLAEPLQLARDLRRAGVSLLCVRATSPNLLDPPAERGRRPRAESQPSHEHPLTVLARKVEAARALRAALPDVCIAGSGFGWLRRFAAQVGAGLVQEGTLDLPGMARGALAYPDAPAEWRRSGALDPAKTCMMCYACSDLIQKGGPVGCVIRDPGEYGPVYRRLCPPPADTPPRCDGCEAAPCVAAANTPADIPGFVRAFEAFEVRHAFEILRKGDLLPGMGVELAWRDFAPEAACIEKTLTGIPVPIRSIQLEIHRTALEQGWTGVRVPARDSGRTVTVVGGGPAGIAAAARLVELRHRVVLIERSDRLGGVPGRLLRRPNFSGGHSEVDALLRPALESGRLEVRFGVALGGGVTLESLCASSDAVLLAAGLWGEASLATDATPAPPGVTGALEFLDRAARGMIASLEGAVAILAGGDTAMDAARTAQRLGAEKIFIVYGGPRSQMHWHMDESWFDTPGVQALMQSRPSGYTTGADGRLTGLRIAPASGAEYVLPVRTVVEAMGLRIDAGVRAALAGLPFNGHGLVDTVPGSFRAGPDRVFAAGAMVNGGAAVSRCVSEGMRAADEIHAVLETA